MLGFILLTTQHMTPMTMLQDSLILVSVAVFLFSCVFACTASTCLLRHPLLEMLAHLIKKPCVSFALRICQSPSRCQDGGKHSDPTGRQSGVAVKLQGLRRDSGGIPEHGGDPV